MTITKGFLTILLSAVSFATAGTLIGWLLAVAAPAYYRGTFSNGQQPWFDPVAVGIGLGLTQGLVCGIVVGGVVVLAVAWYNSRRQDPDVDPVAEQIQKYSVQGGQLSQEERIRTHSGR